VNSPSARTPLVFDGPVCLLCQKPTELLYPSNAPPGLAVKSGEVACTSSDLSVHDDIYLCRDCHLARSVPSIGANELEDLYRNVEDPTYLVSEEERRASFRKGLEEIERYYGGDEPGHLLELGSSVGLFIEEARKKGWKVTGIEPSVWATEQARSRGLHVFTGTLEEFESGAVEFDVVALWDVFEHLMEPMQSLLRMKQLLKPGGILCLTTINIEGFGARLFRARWPWLMRMHLHYFSRHSLQEMMRRVDLEVLRLSTYPKVLKLGYLLERASGMFGPLAAGSLWLARRLHLADCSVKVNLGDILILIARNKA
jgi:2-polyprenyl-3-methyl-5-hydroxy-6-metoxy-1,4-benzoquinol methylase